MKTLRNNSDVCHSFANKQYESAKCGNMFFSTNYENRSTLYSYSNHFAIAQFAIHAETGNEVVLFTENKYSSSTAKQICHAYASLRGKNFVFVPRVLNSVAENIKAYEIEANNQLEKLAFAKKPEIYVNQLDSIKVRAEKYCEFLGLRMPVRLSELLSLKEAPEHIKVKMLEGRKQAKVWAKEKSDREKSDKIKYEAEYEENIIKWYNFDTNYIGRYAFARGNTDRKDFLRFNINTGNVETSQNVKIPAKIALNFYHTLISIKNISGIKNIDVKLMNLYEVRQVTNDYVIIGCHYILFSEIESIIPKLSNYIDSQSISA